MICIKFAQVIVLLIILFVVGLTSSSNPVIGGIVGVLTTGLWVWWLAGFVFECDSNLGQKTL